MIHIVVDSRLRAPASGVARAISQSLTSLHWNGPSASVYLGAGSAFLISPHDPRPHVVVPLTTNGPVDAVARSQVASADAIVLMDRQEAVRLGADARRVPTVVILSAPSDSRARVIHASNPFDAAEVERFLGSTPDMAATLAHLGVEPRPFDAAHARDAILEAILRAAQAPQIDDGPGG